MPGKLQNQFFVVQTPVTITAQQNATFYFNQNSLFAPSPHGGCISGLDFWIFVMHV